jgi:hypothetical protein
MATQAKAVDTELAHRLHHVLCHAAFAVAAVVRQCGRFTRVTIAAQVGHDQVEVLLQALRDAVPHDMGLWETMQQEQGWAIATLTARDMRMNVRALDLKAPDLKIIKPMHQSTFNSNLANQ